MQESTGGIVFRNSRKGYDKNDVNRYIEDMNLRFATTEEELRGRIRELEAQLAAQPSAIDTEAMAERLAQLSLAHETLQNEAESLRTALTEAESKLAAAEEALTKSLPAEDPAPKALSYEEAGSRLGNILLKANLDADRIVAEAEDEGKRRLADAEKSADGIRLDAVVTARLMTERAKEKLAALTSEYLAAVTAFSEESAGEYRKLCEELKDKFRQADISIRKRLQDGH